MNTVKLKNGSIESDTLVTGVMLSLCDLIKEHPIAFYELVTLCRNKHHKLFGNTDKILSEFSLITEVQTVHDSIVNIVLSATRGDDSELELISPIA